MSSIGQVRTAFGIITDTHLVATRRGGRSASPRAIPLDQIASVRQYVQRRPALGTLFIAIATAFYPVLDRPSGLAAAGVFAALGALFLWGTPIVVVTTAGGYARRLTGSPFGFSEADRFVSHLRSALFAARGRAKGHADGRTKGRA